MLGLTSLSFSQDPISVEPPSAGLGIGGGLFGFLFTVLLVASVWKVFVKAGKPGWAALIPIYNVIVLLEIAGKPLWFIVLFFIPVLNFIALVLVAIGLANAFGKGTGFGLGLAFLAPIFYPLLGFGDATYQGSAGAQRHAMA